MKKLLVLLCPYLLFGCAYVEDRGRDAADMITVAAEFPSVGIAVSSAYVGFGVYGGDGHGVGLRSGALGAYDFEEGIWCWAIWSKSLRPSESDQARGKGYRVDLCGHSSGGRFNSGQAEVAVGVGPGVRVGVNFVEILDFILGFVGIDLCDDDIASRRSADAMAPKPQPTAAKRKCVASRCSPARRDGCASSEPVGCAGTHIE